MRPILTLRHCTDDLIVHSHDHAQRVFGLPGALVLREFGASPGASRREAGNKRQ